MDLDEGVREAPPDPWQETREAPSDTEEKTREAPSDPDEETEEAPSDSEEETEDVARLAAGSRDMGGPVVPALRTLTIGGKRPPNNVIAHVESTGVRRRGKSSTAKASADDRRSRRGRRQEECVGVRRRRLDDFAEEGGDAGADSERRVTGTVNRQQAMNALEMEEWRKIQRKKKYKMARPNGKLVVRARMIYKINMKDGEVENYECRLVT